MKCCLLVFLFTLLLNSSKGIDQCDFKFYALNEGSLAGGNEEVLLTCLSTTGCEIYWSPKNCECDISCSTVIESGMAFREFRSNSNTIAFAAAGGFCSTGSFTANAGKTGLDFSGTKLAKYHEFVDVNLAGTYFTLSMQDSWNDVDCNVAASGASTVVIATKWLNGLKSGSTQTSVLGAYATDKILDDKDGNREVWIIESPEPVTLRCFDKGTSELRNVATLRAAVSDKLYGVMSEKVTVIQSDCITHLGEYTTDPTIEQSDGSIASIVESSLSYIAYSAATTNFNGAAHASVITPAGSACISAVQHADSDSGRDATSFIPITEFGTDFVLPFGTTDLVLFSNIGTVCTINSIAGSLMYTVTLTGSSSNVKHAHVGDALTAGMYITCFSGVGIWANDDIHNDKHIIRPALPYIDTFVPLNEVACAPVPTEAPTTLSPTPAPTHHSKANLVSEVGLPTMVFDTYSYTGCDIELPFYDVLSSANKRLVSKIDCISGTGTYDSSDSTVYTISTDGLWTNKCAEICKAKAIAVTGSCYGISQDYISGFINGQGQLDGTYSCEFFDCSVYDFLFRDGISEDNHETAWFLDIDTCLNLDPTAAPTESPTTSPPTITPSTNPTPSPTNFPTRIPTPSPTDTPSVSPTVSPTDTPSVSPSRNPTPSPTSFPTRMPSVSPTDAPSSSPTVSPTDSPSVSPTNAPTNAPTVSPTDNPTLSPTRGPSVSPTSFPTRMPSVSPSVAPSVSPTISPTISPSISPTVSPSVSPTVSPTVSPSVSPTLSPTDAPTKSPTLYPTGPPVVGPTFNPTRGPSVSPTSFPTRMPSVSPSTAPSKSPSQSPSKSPSTSPTTSPTRSPSVSPTESPSNSPTTSPTDVPTLSPSTNPSVSPTSFPTRLPTVSPTEGPSVSPTPLPTNAPTTSPTVSPTNAPTTSPTDVPTNSPSKAPSVSPTNFPTRSPTPRPSNSPSVSPTLSPTDNPTAAPSHAPSVTPTDAPSLSPIVPVPTVSIATQSPTSASPTTPAPSVPTSPPVSIPITTPTTPAPSVSPSDAPTEVQSGFLADVDVDILTLVLINISVLVVFMIFVVCIIHFYMSKKNNDKKTKSTSARARYTRRY